MLYNVNNAPKPILLWIQIKVFGIFMLIRQIFGKDNNYNNK